MFIFKSKFNILEKCINYGYVKDYLVCTSLQMQTTLSTFKLPSQCIKLQLLSETCNYTTVVMPVLKKSNANTNDFIIKYKLLFHYTFSL